MKVRLLLCLAVAGSSMLGCSLVPNVGDVFSQISSEIAAGSGNVVTREFDLSGFDQVEVANAFEVEIRQGDSFSVIVRVDDNVEQYLDVARQGSTLRIGLRPTVAGGASVVTLEAEVTMPELAGLELSGASDVTVAGFESTGPLYVDSSGASSLQGDVEAGGLRFNFSGASDARLSGGGGDLVMEVSGASSVDLSDFPVADADIQVSGASSAAVNVTGRLDLEASGASRVRYRGDPTLGNVDVSGGSSVDAW